MGNILTLHEGKSTPSDMSASELIAKIEEITRAHEYFIEDIRPHKSPREEPVSRALVAKWNIAF